MAIEQHGNLIFELDQRELSEEEMKFGKWIDDCMTNARGELGLDWISIAWQLNGKAQKALAKFRITPDVVK